MNEATSKTTPDATPTIATGGFVYAEIAETGQHIRIHCMGPDGKALSGYLLTVPHALPALAQQLLAIAQALQPPPDTSTQ